MDAARREGPRFSLVSRPPVLSAEELAIEIGKAAASLARWPGVRRIWLFGSAARGEVLDWRSDLDFAVEGLQAADRERAWAALDEALQLPVDLVRIESANPALQGAIAREGRLVYEG